MLGGGAAEVAEFPPGGAARGGGGGGGGGRGGGGGAGLLVQVPGRVRDAGAALEALGGSRAVAAAAATGADLTFRLGGGEGGERLRGRHEPACGLFLRVQRGPGGELASQVAGSFSSAYSFGELGDFVFSGEAGEGAGAGTRAGAESGAEVVGSSGREAVLPPVFSRATVPAAGLAEALAPPPRGGKGAAGARKHLGGLAAGRGPRARKTGGSG